jgi:hypothetical protein
MALLASPSAFACALSTRRCPVAEPLMEEVAFWADPVPAYAHLTFS